MFAHMAFIASGGTLIREQIPFGTSNLHPSLFGSSLPRHGASSSPHREGWGPGPCSTIPKASGSSSRLRLIVVATVGLCSHLLPPLPQLPLRPLRICEGHFDYYIEVFSTLAAKN